MARRRYLLQVRSTDLDWLQHVNNTTYADYLQEARVDLLTLWRGSVLSHPELSMVVRALEISFERPLLYRAEPIAIDTATESVGRTSYTLVHEIREPDGSVLYARARSVMVQVDKATGAPSPIEDDLREHLLSLSDEA